MVRPKVGKAAEFETKSYEAANQKLLHNVSKVCVINNPLLRYLSESGWVVGESLLWES